MKQNGEKKTETKRKQRQKKYGLTKKVVRATKSSKHNKRYTLFSRKTTNRRNRKNRKQHGGSPLEIYDCDIETITTDIDKWKTQMKNNLTEIGSGAYGQVYSMKSTNNVIKFPIDRTRDIELTQEVNRICAITKKLNDKKVDIQCINPVVKVYIDQTKYVHAVIYRKCDEFKVEFISTPTEENSMVEHFDRIFQIIATLAKNGFVHGDLRKCHIMLLDEHPIFIDPAPIQRSQTADNDNSVCATLCLHMRFGAILLHKILKYLKYFHKCKPTIMHQNEYDTYDDYEEALYADTKYANDIVNLIDWLRISPKYKHAEKN